MAGATGGAAVEHAAPMLIHRRLRMGKVVERGTPGCCAVTGFARRAKRACMELRVGMTGCARGRCPRELLVDVATFASHIAMRARQREGTARVIKNGVPPIGWCVTGRTVRAKAAIVLIILRVAGITIRGRALIDIVLVTILARSFRMFSLQLKGRQAMIKFGGLPAIGRVTSRTVRAEAARVRIVRLVTGKTIRGRGCEIRRGESARVTMYTSHLRVFSVQAEGKIIMRESFSKTVGTIVTGQTIGAKIESMRLREDSVDLSMTSLTRQRIEDSDTLRVTIHTGKRLARDSLLVTV